MGKIKDIKLHRISRNIKTLDRGLVAAEHMRENASLMKTLNNQPKEEKRGCSEGIVYAQEVISGSVRVIGKKSGKAVLHQGAKIPQTGRRAGKVLRRTAVSIKTKGSRYGKTGGKTVRATGKVTQKVVITARSSVRAFAIGGKAAARTAVAVAKGTVSAAKTLLAAILAGGWMAVLLFLVVILLGTAVILSGGSEESYTPVSAEVEAYDPVIRIYAGKYGISEYVELIKAVMMQESGGKGRDPMQASECGYNTRYPNTPNGITEPEYSIDVGIQNLAACLTEAGVESPVDMKHIKLALQGYNYGNGYILWARENYGGYTYANAVEFSEMMAERNSWSSYGDKEYVSHVLRYYPFGKIRGLSGSTDLVQTALAEVGNQGGEKYWRWYGFQSYQPWCACFVSWCADQCGYIDAQILPKFSYCSAGVKWFQEQGRFRDRNYVPAPGDIIFFDWGNNGSINHAGIVENVADGYIDTIEGNSSKMVRRGRWAMGDEEIYGYGIYF